MLNLSWKRKNKYIAAKRAEQQKRVLNGKIKLTNDEKERLREKKLKVKDKFEMNNLGNYEFLYPLPIGENEDNDMLMDKYDDLLIKSKEIWEESISGGGYIKKKETEPLPKDVKSSKPLSSQGMRKTMPSF